MSHRINVDVCIAGLNRIVLREGQLDLVPLTSLQAEGDTNLGAGLTGRQLHRYRSVVGACALARAGAIQPLQLHVHRLPVVGVGGQVGVPDDRAVVQGAMDLGNDKGEGGALEDQHVSQAGPGCFSGDIGRFFPGDLGGRVLGSVGQLPLEQQVVQWAGVVKVLDLVTSPALNHECTHQNLSQFCSFLVLIIPTSIVVLS